MLFNIFPKNRKLMSTQKPVQGCLQQLYSSLPKSESNQDASGGEEYYLVLKRKKKKAIKSGKDMEETEMHVVK